MRNKFAMVSDEIETVILSMQQVTEDDVKELSIGDMTALVAKRLQGSSLCDAFFTHNKVLLEALAAKMKVTVFQAIFLSIMLDQEEVMTSSSIARFIGCGTMVVRNHQNEIDELKERHIISCDGHLKRYTLLSDAIDAYCRNKPYVYVIPENLTVEKLMRRIDKILNVYSSHCDDQDYEPLWKDVSELLVHNSHLPLAKTIAEAEHISHLGRLILMYLSTELFLHGHTQIYGRDIESTFWFDSHIEVSGEFELLDLETNGYLEAECMDGLRDNERFCLTDKACTSLFVGLGLEKLKNDKFSMGLINPNTVTKKKLFYNAEDKEQVTQLCELLKQENFEQVCNRLESEGLRKGFACLFYGAPGCGKTETVYQICKATGRSMIFVNVSDIMSKWVGESEKHIRCLFAEYRDKVHHLDKAPVIIFNEADAIIHRRHTQIDHAVDQMSNSIQNIILEEMESLEGIMIATTNLTENLDKAFDRRFLYKIEFHKPDLATRSKIWSSMMPTLTQEEADSLASEFDLTGGEIENVVRKTKINYILSGIACNFETLQSICRNETIKMRDSNKKKVGF